MYRPIRYSLLLALLIALAACKKNNGAVPINHVTFTQMDSSDSALIGSWNWVLTCDNGVAAGPPPADPFGDSITPASTGIHELLTFDANGAWNVVQNNATVNQGTYKFSLLLSPEGPIDMLDMIRAGGTDSILNHIISHDTLTLFDAQVVGVDRNWVYVKVTNFAQ